MTTAGAGAARGAGRARPRSTRRLVAAGLVAAALFAGLCALGAWQIHRLAWKQTLIARVEARIHAPPAAAPGPGAWPTVSAAADEYRHVSTSGRFLAGRDAFVQAVTDLGAGYWVISPLETRAGFTVLVNRGFVPPDGRDAAPPPGGEVTVTGLVRMSEPGGGFLRSNDAAADRWHSRDVAAIAAARGLGPVAPYFIDADAAANAAGGPVGGLTVVRFPNNHLVYALTWFALALMLAIGAIIVARREIALRRGDAGPAGAELDRDL